MRERERMALPPWLQSLPENVVQSKPLADKHTFRVEMSDTSRIERFRTFTSKKFLNDCHLSTKKTIDDAKYILSISHLIRFGNHAFVSDELVINNDSLYTFM